MQKIFLLFCLLMAGNCVIGQTLPPYTCGILYTYNNAGHRTKQEYYCRQARGINTTENGSVDSLALDENAVSTSFAKTDAIYPNPNDGRFTIRFEQALKNADIILTDVNGKKVKQFKANGTIVHVDISTKPAGTYFLIITDGKIKITQKVIKQY
jgi:hypothetical protein